MATIQSTMSLNDRMSTTLSSIVKAMHSTISTMQSANKENGSMSNAFKKAQTDINNFGNGPREYYWLASRCIANTMSAMFYVRTVSIGRVYGSYLVYSYDIEKTFAQGLRPIVYLKSDIKLKKDNTGIWQFVEE